MKINRRIAILILLVVIIPALFFTIYQIGALNQNEKVIEEIYNNQLDVILSSVNRYSDDVASGWEFKMNNYFSSPQLNLYNSLHQYIHDNPSMKGVFYCTDSSTNNIEIVLRDYNLSIVNQQKIISGLLAGHSKVIKKLYVNLQKGWRKIEPFSSPNSSKLLYFVFIADNLQGKKTLCGIIVDVQEFVNQVLAQKIQAIVEDRFIISILKDKEKKVIYSSEPVKYNQVLQVKPLWLLPDMKLGIIFKGRTIEQLVRDRTYINFVMILLLDILFLCGTWFVFRSIRNEIQLAKMRADFISNVSHEIRTPLSLISLYIETIMMGRVKQDKLQQYYNIIHQETGRLIGIVNKILNFSKIEEKKLVYNFKPVNLNEVVEIILDRYNYQLTNKDFIISNTLEPDLPLINGDREALIEVMVNLIDNIIKYSIDEKFIGIETLSDNEKVIISFSDHGIGIPEQQQKYVFDKFFRVSDMEVSNIKGSGLGLTIVKNIVENHNGTITLHSNPGKGTTFKIVFPKLPDLDN